MSSMIRGKLESDREVVPREIFVGEPLFRKCDCGCEKYFDRDNNEVQVTETTLEEMLKTIPPLCQRKKP